MDIKKKNMSNVKSLPRARIPICKFVDPITNIKCDISVGNELAIYNTKLLADYCSIDHRLSQLGYLVKYWAKQRQINEPYQGTLSSYAYILLVINFLQQRPQPIVPVLQQMSQNEDQRTIVDGFDCTYFKKVESLKDFGSSNKETLGELLIAFFKWYSHDFDWENCVASVRLGKVISKSAKNWDLHKARIDEKTGLVTDYFYFAIEDPFEITHNLGRLVDPPNLKVLKEEFLRAYRLTSSGTPLSKVFKAYIG